MKPHTTRAYNSFRIDNNSSKIVKVSSTSRLKDEICYYSKIKDTSLCHFFPRVFSYSKKQPPYELELEYYDYDDLGLHMVNSCEEGLDWEKIACKLVSVLNAFRIAPAPFTASPKKIKREMYIEKTLYYQKDLIQNFNFFTEIDKEKELTVNGEKILNFNSIWDSIKKLVEEILINDKPLSIIHGDMCFSNILCSKRKNVLRFIDPRGSFGSQGVLGDPLYDTAKLTHSFDGCYEYIINDKFKINQLSTRSFDFSFENEKHKLIKSTFLDHSQFSSIEVNLIQGLIFIGMCSRHYDSLDRQIVMYLTGLKILNKFL
tara:strand:- start:101 stop:1048 length:948 start_codon:yes stop_codon:yes gene_type:complete